jgi:radical SAM protein with 4Fe4S-binding SPASM domain
MKSDVATRYFLGIEIEINHHCNLACSYCPNSNTERINKGLMSFEQFKSIMQQLADINYTGKISYHFYNEPTLHPELARFVRTSKEMLPETRSEIFTNGVFLTKEKFDELRAAGVDKFSVTKHKDTKKIVFDETFAQLSNEEKKHVKYIDHTQLIFTSRGGLVEAGKKIEAPLSRTCLIPTCTMIVTVNGNVLTCYEDYNEKHIMGNVFEEHVKDIWEKPPYKAFREDLKKGMRYKYEVCKTCNNFQVLT